MANKCISCVKHSTIRLVSFFLLFAILFQSGCKRISVPEASGPIQTSTPAAEPTTDANLAKAILNEMTIQEKIGQLIATGYSKDSLGLLGELKPGGIIFSKGDCQTPAQTLLAIKDMNESSRIPLIITCSEEGGAVTRITGNGMPTTLLPGLEVIGKTGDPNDAFLAGKVLGSELVSLGFNLDLAPVADVYSNAANKIIAGRSFGGDPRMVAAFVSQMVKGMRAEGVGTTLKHFPGHGNASEDSHSALTYNYSTMEQLLNTDLLPFMAGIEAGTDAVMIGHIILPNLQTEKMPATVSYEVTTGLLREKLGFQGLIISDSMDMSGMVNYLSMTKASVAAVNAGIDLLLIPLQSAKAVYQALNTAFTEGKLSAERIDAAVTKILLFKLEHHVFDNRQTPDPNAVLGSEEHRLIVNEIIRKSAQKK